MELSYFEGKTVLVTGGTGSFGKKCVNFLLRYSKAKKIIIFSRDELKQSFMGSSIPDPNERLRFFLGDIRDIERLRRAFGSVDYIIHAAALKQVPALEYDPYEAIKTNILGTQNIIEAAIDCGVEKVMMVSTDKAANPANLYGATKLCAEKLMVNGNMYSGTKKTVFSVVRYGNVLGSRGSLLHIIKEKKKQGCLSLTHPEMTRFWLTIDEGVRFVLSRMRQMHGGEIFVPKIPSMKIVDVFSTLASGCEIKIIGIRPGEKLHEVLITKEEARHTKEYKDFYVILPEGSWWDHFEKYNKGNSLEENFYFSSDRNSRWISGDEMRILADRILY
jgi:UDP-N-acetylglucosamine 4,6-dehydratase